MLTKGAIGNLINRYRAVLKKCHLMNTFGSLAVASMLVLGGAGVAGATDRIIVNETTPTITHDYEFKNLETTEEEKGTTEDEMAGWHHGLDGRESE